MAIWNLIVTILLLASMAMGKAVILSHSGGSECRQEYAQFCSSNAAKQGPHNDNNMNDRNNCLYSNYWKSSVQCKIYLYDRIQYLTTSVQSTPMHWSIVCYPLSFYLCNSPTSHNTKECMSTLLGAWSHIDSVCRHSLSMELRGDISLRKHLPATHTTLHNNSSLSRKEAVRIEWIWGKRRVVRINPRPPNNPGISFSHGSQPHNSLRHWQQTVHRFGVLFLNIVLILCMLAMGLVMNQEMQANND